MTSPGFSLFQLVQKVNELNPRAFSLFDCLVQLLCPKSDRGRAATSCCTSRGLKMQGGTVVLVTGNVRGHGG
jgi:hypothetical protein